MGTSGGIYIVNCRDVKDGFFGPLEVFSQQAVKTFLANAKTCDTELEWKKQGKQWGEDKFAERCMAAHGVDMIEAKSKMAQQQGVKYASIKMEPRVQKCTDKKALAFHPLRKPYDYFECVKTTQA